MSLLTLTTFNTILGSTLFNNEAKVHLSPTDATVHGFKMRPSPASWIFAETSMASSWKEKQNKTENFKTRQDENKANNYTQVMHTHIETLKNAYLGNKISSNLIVPLYHHPTKSYISTHLSSI